MCSGRYTFSKTRCASAWVLIFFSRIFFTRRSWWVPWFLSTRPFACGELAAMMRIPSRWHICPNCVTGTTPCNCSFALASRTYTFFQSVYNATGMPYFLTQTRNTPTAAQIVSSPPHAGQRISAGIVHHVHQAATRPSLLQPVVETSIHLHQLAHMCFPL